MYFVALKGSTPLVHCLVLNVTLGTCEGRWLGAVEGCSDGFLGMVLTATLGTCVYRWVGVVEGYRDGSMGRSGIAVTRYKACAILSNSFLVVSSVSSLIVVVEDGLVRMDIMSKAACLKKTSVLTSGNGTTLGMKVTVSTSLHVWVCGK